MFARQQPQPQHGQADVVRSTHRLQFFRQLGMRAYKRIDFFAGRLTGAQDEPSDGLVVRVGRADGGAVRVLGAELDPGLMTTSLHTGSEMSGHAIVSEGVRTLTPFFNIYGTLALVGGAAYSAFLFWRKKVLLHRTIGNVLIALGAILPAFGGTFSRMGVPGALYVGELLGAVILFIGFLRAITPIGESETELAD